MAISFEGVLADRSTWRLDNCSIGKAMEVIGTRSSMLILREAFCGTTRFDDFARRTRIGDAIVAARLRDLTAIGLFTKRSYREPGRRARFEYLLTEKGRDLFPAVFALMQWGNQHLQGDDGGPLRLVERGTGEPVVIGARTASGRGRRTRGRRDRGPRRLGHRAERLTVNDLDIRWLPGDASALVADVAVLINRVYAVAEQGLWRSGAERTSAEEVSRMALAGEIAVARLDGRLVGCVRIQRLDEVTGEFGMLAADPACRGVGIGRELVRFAEQAGREAGLAVMQLEVLFPREWSHPSKEFLAAWYGRIGYRKIRTGAVDESYPDLAPLLATPCDFVIYNKDLKR